MSNVDKQFEYMKREWKKWKKENPEIMKAVDKYFDKIHEIEGPYCYILGRRA